MTLWHPSPNIDLPVSTFQVLVLVRPLWATRISSAELHLFGVLTPWCETKTWSSGKSSFQGVYLSWLCSRRSPGSQTVFWWALVKAPTCSTEQPRTTHYGLSSFPSTKTSRNTFDWKNTSQFLGWPCAQMKATNDKIILLYWFIAKADQIIKLTQAQN